MIQPISNTSNIQPALKTEQTFSLSGFFSKFVQPRTEGSASLSEKNVKKIDTNTMAEKLKTVPKDTERGGSLAGLFGLMFIALMIIIIFAFSQVFSPRPAWE